MMQDFKKPLVEFCELVLSSKIELISNSINEITSSMEQESKSSLGDKHETSRARMQIEHEKLGEQLNELKLQYNSLKRIQLNQTTTIVSKCSLVITDKGIFFILIPLGKIEFEGKSVFVISDKSPIGKLMMGKNIGEEFSLNSTKYKIENIV